MKQREIKFRAWHEEVGVDGVRFPGWMEYDPDWQNVSAVRREHKEAIEALATDHFRSERARLNKIFSETTIPLMQFTGLLDRHGKEIYEGDVAEIVNPYEGKRGRFEVKIPDIFTWQFQHAFKMEVIGNIYQNPELLR